MAENNYNEQRMKEITERLEKGVKEMFTSERYTQYLKTMSQFHTYSFNNTLLIAMQRPDATLVAGYQAWQKKFNRQVKHGEKGIQIISPYPVKHRELREKIDEKIGETVLKPDGEPEMEEVVHTIPRFRVATVFDVSQTVGEPLPELATDELTGSVEDYNIFMVALESVSSVPIRFTEIEGDAKGFYSTATKETVIQSGMSEIQTVKTAIHETAHAKLHDRDIMKEQGVMIDKMEREVQAESIAYTVCQHFGIDTSDYSFPYVASWSSGKDMKELRASMDTIRHTATEFIDALTEQIQIIRDERAQEIESAEYQEVEIFEIPALFSNGRIADEQIPAGMYRYDLRGSDDDPGSPVTVAPNVVVNHAGSILTMFPITFPERGFLYLGEELNFVGGMATVSKYRDNVAGMDAQELDEKMQNAVVQANEELLLGDTGDRYAIYQLRDDGDGADYRFLNFDYVSRNQMAVKGADYNLLYGGKLTAEDTLEGFYARFNMNRPASFTGHSLSVSDIIVTNQGGKPQAFYVDSVGFQELPDFVKEREQLWKQEKTKTRVTEFTEEIELEGHIGTWHTVDSIDLMGQTIYLMESNEHGEQAANVAVDADGVVVAQDLRNGFDGGFHEAAVEYFAEKGITYEVPEHEAADSHVSEATAVSEEKPVTEEAENLDVTDNLEADKEAMPEQSNAGEPVHKRKLYSGVYHNNAQYAREHGELDRYRQSRRENIACKEAIEQAIRDNFDGLHLNPDAVYTVLDQFGNERVSFVLASTVQTKNYDTRFSGSNREWAKQKSFVEEADSIAGDGLTAWVVESHPAVLDGYITQTRNEILNRALEAVETRLVTRVSKNLEVKGYPGTWHTYDWKDYNSTRFLLMRNDNPELGQADLILSENGELVAHDVKHGFDQEARLAVSEYLKKYGETLYGMDTLPEKATVTLTDGTVLYTSSAQKLLKSEWEESLVGKDQSGNERYFNFHEIARVHEPGGIYLDMPEIHVIQKIFVTADLQSEPMQKTEYPSMEEALGAYFNLPDDKMKSLGIEVTTPDTKNFLLLQCFDGKDTVTYGRATKDSFLNPEIYKAVKDVEQGLAAHLKTIEKDAADKPLTVDEITDFNCVKREYYGASRIEEYVFECKVRGEPDMLTYELSYHDDGEGFSLHTENNDIWNRMSYRELEKLEAVVSKEVTFDYWMKEVEKTSSSRGVKEVEYAMAETEYLNLTGDQRSRIYQRMEEKEATFIAFYYIDNDRHGSRPGSMYQEFPDIESALDGYAKIPNHFDKEIGMESTEKHPSRMPLIECKNGIDRLYDIEGASLSGKWVTEEVMDAHAKAGDFLENQDVEIAYHLKPTGQYFTISTVEEGYAYAFYDKSFHQVNGSEYWNTEMDIEEARNTVLASAGIVYTNCEVIDYANLMGEVEKAAQQTVEPKLSFYVAECAEFPILGEYHESLTLEEAVEAYKLIPSERMNGVKTIGFQLVDDSIYSGMDMDMLTGFEVDRESVNHVEHYRNSPLVQKALDDLEVALQPVHEAERSKSQRDDAAQELLKATEQERPNVIEQKRPKAAESEQPKTEAPTPTEQPVRDKAEEESKKSPAHSARTDASGGTRTSVLQALRERTAKQKEREKQQKQPAKKAPAHKKGEQSL